MNMGSNQLKIKRKLVSNRLKSQKFYMYADKPFKRILLPT